MFEIKMYDIVRVMLLPERKQSLRGSAFELCNKLVSLDGCTLQVTGIRRLTEPEERRSYSLSPLKGKMLAGEMIMATRADIVYMQDGEAPKTENDQINAQKAKSFKQEELF
ncbi:MAG: hypothetical protein EHM72_12215 [Calditrichaeota bacterium]|nr:MAG: hypothetical protein EHM72_12215 [Calditrichota bacterium]